MLYTEKSIMFGFADPVTYVRYDLHHPLAPTKE